MRIQSNNVIRFEGESSASDVLESSGQRRRMFVILTMAPAVIVLFMLTIYPFLANIWYSLLSYDLTLSEALSFVGLRNYIEVLMTGIPRGLATHRVLIVLAVGVELILGFLVALLLVQNLRGQRLFRALLVIPLATPVAVGLIWRLMYNPTGGWLTVCSKPSGCTAHSGPAVRAE